MPANDSQMGIVKTRKIKMTASQASDIDPKQLSPGAKYNSRPAAVNGLNYGNQNLEGQHSRNQLNNKLLKMRSTQANDINQSYQDMGNATGGDRSVTNRTPLLENYQNTNPVSYANHGHVGNQSTSVPRPTIASELRLLKEMRGSPVG